MSTKLTTKIFKKKSKKRSFNPYGRAGIPTATASDPLATDSKEGLLLPPASRGNSSSRAPERTRRPETQMSSLGGPFCSSYFHISGNSEQPLVGEIRENKEEEQTNPTKNRFQKLKVWLGATK